MWNPFKKKSNYHNTWNILEEVDDMLFDFRKHLLDVDAHDNVETYANQILEARRLLNLILDEPEYENANGHFASLEEIEAIEKKRWDDFFDYIKEHGRSWGC
jgi:hypothetical protein